MVRSLIGASVLTVALLTTFSCATAPRSDVAMFRHFDGARELRTAAIFGRAEQAQAAAVELRRENPLADAPPASDRYYNAFFESVADLVGAQPPDALAQGAARVALRCGECHTARGLGPTFALGGPRDADNLREHMIVHSWASSRMWESLLGASDESWRAGAQALIDQRMGAALYDGRVPDPDAATELSNEMYAIGQRALGVSDAPGRARVLGDLWATCARCHALAGVR